MTINQIYNEEYFKDYAKQTTGLWWSSTSRPNSEDVIEIDLGRKRLFNYISFDILRKPFEIKIEYDAIELNSLGLYANAEHRWVEVEPLGLEMRFDNKIDFDPSSTTSWFNAEFYIEPVFARRLRISFFRTLSGGWPTEAQTEFPFTVDVNNLRVMRYIMNPITDSVGEIIDIDSYDSIFEVADNVKNIRQRFTLPSNFSRTSYATNDLTNISGFSPSDIYPNITGFGLFVLFADKDVAADIFWEIYDVTYGETLLKSGLNEIIRTPREIRNFGDESTLPQPDPFYGEWIDFIFDDSIPTNPDSRYELRFRCSDNSVLNSFYFKSVDQDDENNDFYYEENSGNVIRQPKNVLTYRVFGDVGHSGVDLLGNEYREGIRFDGPEKILDKKDYSFWTSGPNPSPNGVEALYIDIRNSDGTASIIDGFEIGVGSPGIMMNVYYSTTDMIGASPNKTEDWENMMWRPIPQSYILNKKEEITFPTIRAKFICLEFYNLQPRSLNFPEFPFLPPVKYKEFPEWVIQQSVEQKTKSFINTGTQVVRIPFYDNFNSTIVDPAYPINFDQADTDLYRQTIYGYGQVDQRTGSQIGVNGYTYTSIPEANIDRNSILGQSIKKEYSALVTKGNGQSESRLADYEITSREVSNINNRPSYIQEQHKAMMFNRVCAHQYDEYLGHFNKKAYYVSISEISFFRKDYSTRNDDEYIRDILYDEDINNSPLIEYNNWKKQNDSRIFPGQKLYVSYMIGDIEYVDEEIVFENGNIYSFNPVALQRGGILATNLKVFSEKNGNGEMYIRDYDYVLSYDSFTNTNYIVRNPLHFRLVVSDSIPIANDKKTVRGFAEVSAIEETRFSLGVNSNGETTIDGNLFIPLNAEIISGATLYAIPPIT